MIVGAGGRRPICCARPPTSDRRPGTARRSPRAAALPRLRRPRRRQVRPVQDDGPDPGGAASRATRARSRSSSSTSGRTRGAARPYGIRLIPTQIFFAADGTELFRHEGFFSPRGHPGQVARTGRRAAGPRSADRWAALFESPDRRRRGRAPRRPGRGLGLGRAEHRAESLPPGQHPADRRVHPGARRKRPGRGGPGLSTLFAAGILVTIAVIGVVTAAAGRLLGDVGAAGNVLVGVIFLAGRPGRSWTSCRWPGRRLGRPA